MPDFRWVRVRLAARCIRVHTGRLIVLMVHHTPVLHLEVRPIAVRHLELLPMGVRHMEGLHMAVRLLRRPIVPFPDYLRLSKNDRISSAKSLGSSIAAKCPPRGIIVHC